LSSDDSDKDEALTTELDKELAMSIPAEKLGGHLARWGDEE
jgi:hypothetical protein